jgi:eukaryotic-like serine/threonine-protein kinase
VLWPRPVPEPAVPAAPALGDPASADPCSLLRAEPFERFGEATLENDYGNFDRCDVIMESGPDRFAVRAQFIQSPDELPEGVREDRGGVVVVRSGLVDEQCTRWLRLPDGYDVWIVARSERGAIPDLCAVADVATDTALAVLARGPVPRRQVPFDPASLAVVDSCGLLDPATVATVPGLETADPDPGFAEWECTWDTRTTEAAIEIRYDHNTGLDEDMGVRTRIAGRDAAVESEGDGLECDVTILHRTYIDQFGNPYSELMDVEVRQPEPVADPCPQAVAVATVAVERLPAAP